MKGVTVNQRGMTGKIKFYLLLAFILIQFYVAAEIKNPDAKVLEMIKMIDEMASSPIEAGWKNGKILTV